MTASFRSTYGYDGITRPGELNRAWADAEAAAGEDFEDRRAGPDR